VIRTPRWLAELPVPLRYAVVGGLLAGIPGCLLGLIVGLNVYLPTAWFATVELGIPIALAGAIVGLLVGSLVLAHRRPAQPSSR
jgi:hypothetical protein